MAATDPFPLPRGWTKTTRSSVLHAISLAFTALTRAWGSSATSRRRTIRLQADLDQAMTEIALLNEELAIKNDRLRRVAPRRRPHYGPIQRMRILKLKAARGWSSSRVARAFAITEETIASWLKRVDEQGERALVQLSEPVNKFPAYVAYLVRWLKSMCPAMGKLRIAQVLGRAGLRLGATTVRGMLQANPESTEPAEAALSDEPIVVSTRVLRAKRPDHIWHLDLTVIPTTAGFWVPWQPFSKLLRWPFCWWVVVAIDQFSRRVCGFALFKKAPSSIEVCGFLDRLTKRARTKPAHIITDQGRQFIAETFKSWCRRRHVRPRYGAVGKQGSVAVIERFIRSMKVECTRQILVPFRLDAMREELACYVIWYNEHRPHQGLDGMTPAEVYVGEASPSPGVRFEPRPRWSTETGRDGRCRRACCLHLIVNFVEGRRHLPVVELTQAA
ncbi:MAG: transposase [Planctomycetota bacterium]|jgi:transposase InsO family protein